MTPSSPSSVKRWFNVEEDAPPARSWSSRKVRASPSRSCAGILGLGRLPIRTRELPILRTTARAGAEYEWGVHAAAFAAAAGLGGDEITATVMGAPDDPVRANPADGVALAVADDLHNHDMITEELWEVVAAIFTADQILEMVICCGWYRMLSTVIRTAEVSAEGWAVPFPDRLDGGRFVEHGKPAQG
jgi:4-carboxymuconolactone decarboxylase